MPLIELQQKIANQKITQLVFTNEFHSDLHKKCLKKLTFCRIRVSQILKISSPDKYRV